MGRPSFAIDRHMFAGTSADLYEGRGAECPVVVKFLRDYGNPNARRSFSNQVRVLARGHYGTVPLLFADVRAQRPYYVMPLLRRGNLEQYAGRLSGEELRFVADCIGSTLARMHQSFDIHGDVKLTNALVDDSGRIRLSDPLGNPLPPLGMFTCNPGGTRGYWAPEVRAGGSVSTCGDVYSFGATVWHLATGRCPVDGQRFDSAIDGFVGDAAIREMVVACCQPDPGERPSMTEALRILKGESWLAIKAQRDNIRVAGAVAVAAAALILYLTATNGPKSRG
jgi:serine/threonine protein kinase